MARGAVAGPFKVRRHDHDACVEAALGAARQVCARRRRRLTGLRQRVLELVWARHQPVGAYDILAALRGERKGAAPATVYRALEFLQESGLVHRIESRNAFVGCAAPRAPHSGQFLLCRGCNAVAEMDSAEVGEVLARQAAELGFRVEGQTVELGGLCPDCAGGA